MSIFRLFQRHLLMAASIAGVAIGAGPAPAQDIPSCSAVICLGGMLRGLDINPTCQPYVDTYFAIQIWTPLFNPPATAAARAEWLALCPADPDTQLAIGVAFGALPFAP